MGQIIFILINALVSLAVVGFTAAVMLTVLLGFNGMTNAPPLFFILMAAAPLVIVGGYIKFISGLAHKFYKAGAFTESTFVMVNIIIPVIFLIGLFFYVRTNLM